MDSRRYSELMEMLGGPVQANVAVGIARGESAGQVDPRLSALSPVELAEFDRFTQAANVGQSTPHFAAPVMGVAHVGASAANELSKTVPGLQDLIGKMLGQPQFRTDRSTSRASLGNVKGTAKGFLAGLLGG